jgi:hypothetical protein
VRVPWVPLNLGAFLIILGVFLLSAFIGVMSLGAAFPLVFAVFGIWLALLGVTMSPNSNPYGAPRSMVLGWGAVLTGLGVLWFVGFNLGELLPVTFAVLVILAGIAAVGYSFMRAQPKKPSAAVA